jgi:nucleoside-diphosphate-sugar epimerase
MCKQSILITGATGFVGRAIIDHLIAGGNYLVYGTSRSNEDLNTSLKQYKNVDASDHDKLFEIVQGIDCIVHAMARVHIISSTNILNEDEFFKVNVESTKILAEAAIKFGVRRFIYISSIKVNGEETQLGAPFKETDPPNPKGPYAISKYLAEQELKKIFEGTNTELVIIRPPLVYGIGAKANFKSLKKFIMTGLPLPLGAFNLNKRSFIALDNLVDFIEICIRDKAAAGQTFLISDDDDASTLDFIKTMASAMSVRMRIISLPPMLIKLIFAIFNKSDSFKSIAASLQVDVNKAKSMLNWQPRLTLKNGMRIAMGNRHEENI